MSETAARDDCRRIAAQVLAGRTRDPTYGARHFCTVDYNPDWAAGKTPCTRIGNHKFYNDVQWSPFLGFIPHDIWVLLQYEFCCLQLFRCDNLGRQLFEVKILNHARFSLFFLRTKHFYLFNKKYVMFICLLHLEITVFHEFIFVLFNILEETNKWERYQRQKFIYCWNTLILKKLLNYQVFRALINWPTKLRGWLNWRRNLVPQDEKTYQ